ncbi:hypothetical protein [Phocaeicola faecalis]
MKKKLIISNCHSCPYSQIASIMGRSGVYCFNRPKVHPLENNTLESIPDDCPLETVVETEPSKPKEP